MNLRLNVNEVVIARQHLPDRDHVVGFFVLVEKPDGELTHLPDRNEIDALDAPGPTDVQAGVRFRIPNAAKTPNHRPLARVHLRQRRGDGPDDEPDRDQR